MSESPSADPTALFNEGLAHHQRGDAARAEEIYRQVLALHPMHFDALHLLGVIAMQNRNFDRAVELIGMAIAVEPNNPLYADAYSNRGMAFRALGKKPSRAIRKPSNCGRTMRQPTSTAPTHIATSTGAPMLWPTSSARRNCRPRMPMPPTIAGCHLRRWNIPRKP